MKCTLDRDAFEGAVSTAVRCCIRNCSIPILSNILLTPGDSVLRIAGTDLDMRMETSVSADIDGSGPPITTNGETLKTLLSRLPHGSHVSLEWEQPVGPTSLRSGKSKYKLLALPATDYPVMEGDPSAVIFSIPGKELSSALNGVRFAVSKDRSRPYIMGALIHFDADGHPSLPRDQRLRVVATDGADLAIASLVAPVGADKIPPVIIPDLAIHEIVQLGKQAGDESVQVSLSDRLASISFGKITFTTKLIDGMYPGYARAIPMNGARTMIVDCAELSRSIQRILSIGESLCVRASISDGKLTLSIRNHETGEGEEELEVEWEGDPMLLGIRARSFISFVDGMQAEQCEIRLVDPRSPIVVQARRGDSVDATRTYISMPVSAA